MKKVIVIAGAALLLATTLVVSCSKDDSDSGSTMLKVKMTDSPYNAEEVNVDIQEVRVRYNDDTLGGWASLSTNARVYNLLTLQNGVDTVLAAGTIPVNTVKELRFVLGSNNSIKIAGVTYPLSVPSGAESGLKIKVHKTVSASLDSLLIDFDATLSVHQTGTGLFQLRPVLRVK